MKSEKASFAQMMFIIVLFNFGSSVVIGISDGVVQDAWVSILAAAVLAVPLFCMYARIYRLFPEKNFFEILEIVFGKIGGKALTVLFVWYAAHLGALILRDFSEFTEISAMPETPQLPIMILMVLTTVYLARSNARVIGKWSVTVFFLVLSVVMLTFLAAIPQFNLDDLMPFFEHSPSEIAQATFGVFAFPYAETVILLGLADSFEKKDNPYKLFLYALIIIIMVFLAVFLRNIALLGNSLVDLDYFPSYVTARIIGISGFLARIEGSISSNFLFAGIVKIAICLLVASKGMAHLFNLEHYRPMVMPMGMLVLALCTTLYQNTMQLFLFLTYYSYYAFPFQVILPLAAWIGGEIYVKKHKQTDLGS